MEKFRRQIALSTCCALLLSGCVTQTYENDNTTPVVQNESSNNEIAMTRISLGLGYLKMGNTTQAKLNLEKAKRFAPNLVQVYTAFAHYYDTVDEPELAIESYKKALSIKHDDADTLNNYGVFLCKQGRYEEAEKQTLKAIAIPSYLLVAKSYENLALCQLKAKNFEKAEHYLEKSIVHSPANDSSLLQMMRFQYAKMDYVSAQAYLKRYEKATRRIAPEAIALAFKIYQKQGQVKTARNYGAMLVKMFPNSFEARQYLLNELDHIEADKLAQEYQQYLRVKAPKKKRVVKLSPNASPTKPEIKRESKVQPSQETEQVTKHVGSPQRKPASNSEVPQQAATERENAASKADNDTSTNTVTLPVHVVTKGDSLYSISKKYNIHMKAIERWNKISRSNVLKIGDVLYLANPKSIKNPE